MVYSLIRPPHAPLKQISGSGPPQAPLEEISSLVWKNPVCHSPTGNYPVWLKMKFWRWIYLWWWNCTLDVRLRLVLNKKSNVQIECFRLELKVQFSRQKHSISTALAKNWNWNRMFLRTGWADLPRVLSRSMFSIDLCFEKDRSKRSIEKRAIDVGRKKSAGEGTPGSAGMNVAAAAPLVRISTCRTWVKDAHERRASFIDGRQVWPASGTFDWHVQSWKSLWKRRLFQSDFQL